MEGSSFVSGQPPNNNPRSAAAFSRERLCARYSAWPLWQRDRSGWKFNSPERTVEYRGTEQSTRSRGIEFWRVLYTSIDIYLYIRVAAARVCMYVGDFSRRVLNAYFALGDACATSCERIKFRETNKRNRTELVMRIYRRCSTLLESIRNWPFHNSRIHSYVYQYFPGTICV